MIKKLILILIALFFIDYTFKVFFFEEKNVIKKYEYKGKYKDKKKERIVFLYLLDTKKRY